jgi:dienelactone hydrolase
VAATPFWFGPDERPLFGWWHAPDDGQAKGGVVLCPPFGQEYMGTHRTFRFLGEALADAGLVALRLDYDGTGDSAGSMTDADRLEAWMHSIRAAWTLLRGAGVPNPGLVGMRLGALLAARAASALDGVGPLVLWDPTRSGRAFIREQQALASMSHQMGTPDDDLPEGWVDAPAWVYSAETVAELRELDLNKIEGSLAHRILVVARPDRARDEKLATRLEPLDVTWIEADDQAALIDSQPSQNAVPHGTLRRVTAWLAEGTGAAAKVVGPATEKSTFPVGGQEVSESPVWLGPEGLFGILTEPARRHGPTAVFLDVAAEHHVGPARLWVELARTWAATAGIRSVRFDLRGLGDSPSDPETTEQLMYAPTVVDDIVAVAQAVSSDQPSDVVLIGLCSGAYAAMDAAVELKPTGICALNPAMRFRPPTFAAGPTAVRPLVHGLRHRITPDMYERLSRLRFLAREARAVALDRLGRERLPRTVLRRLATNGTDVLLVAGAQQIAGPPAPPRPGLLPKATPGLHIVSPDDLDHSLLANGSRRSVAQLLTNHLAALADRASRA